MLSGKRPVNWDTAFEGMNEVLQDAPEESPEVPFGPGRIEHCCLEKQPDNRFQPAQDLALAIESAGTGSTPAQAPPSKPLLLLPRPGRTDNDVRSSDEHRESAIWPTG
jgi:hypothetical protein